MNCPPGARAGKNQHKGQHAAQQREIARLGRDGAAGRHFRRLCDRLLGKREDADRPGDVLNLLLAAVRERQRQLASDLIESDLRHAQSTGFADRFKPRRNIHAVAEDILVVDYDFADVDAGTEHNTLIVRRAGIARKDFLLHRDGTGDSIDNAGKFDQQPVAGRFDDTSAISGNRRIDLVLARGLERPQRTNLVGAHQAAVADNVHGQDRGKFSVDALVLIQSRSFGGGYRLRLAHLAQSCTPVCSRQCRWAAARSCGLPPK